MEAWQQAHLQLKPAGPQWGGQAAALIWRRTPRAGVDSLWERGGRRGRVEGARSPAACSPAVTPATKRYHECSSTLHLPTPACAWAESITRALHRDPGRRGRVHEQRPGGRHRRTVSLHCLEETIKLASDRFTQQLLLRTCLRWLPAVQCAVCMESVTYLIKRAIKSKLNVAQAKVQSGRRSLHSGSYISSLLGLLRLVH